MQNLRVLRQRIRSVQNTQKITKAMQMVAGAKLRRMQEELFAFRPYADALEKIAQRFLAERPRLTHPLLLGAAHPELVEGERLAVRASTGSARTEPPPAGLVVLSSDTGLCGTYNERVLELAERFLAEHPSAVTVAIGRKGARMLARRGVRRAREALDWGGRYDARRMEELLEWLTQRYLEGTVSGWAITYTRFLSALSWKPVIEGFLPVERPPEKEYPEKVIAEPDTAQFLEQLLRQHVRARIARVALEAFTAEHSARMIAMKNATDNAGEMIDTLTLVRNKARQAAITKELIEVVSGAEALR